MKALSVRCPWPWYLLNGAKTVENRPQKFGYRGPLLIHVSATFPEAEVLRDLIVAQELAKRAGAKVPVPTMRELRAMRGCVVGQVQMVDCIQAHPSPFFFGPYGLVFTDPVWFRQPVPFKGQLGLFDVPDDRLKEVAGGAAPQGAGDLFAGVE